MTSKPLWNKSTCSEDFSLRSKNKWDFQLKAAEKIVSDCHNRKFVGALLGSAVGSGKTTILIHAINLIVEKISQSKILFLTHGQNSLKSQTLEAFENPPPNVSIGFSFGTLKSASQVHVAIPQEFSLHSQISSYTHIVIDEAHEWFSSDSVLQTIIKKLNHPKIILATGSVSLFNKYNKIFSDRPFATTYISGDEMHSVAKFIQL